jgi:ribosomal protein S18 acetylase RimI-like enzyme
MVDMLPRLFIDHFHDTSFLLEKDGQLRGFVIGFVSQSHPEKAYIHFVGVNPDARKEKVGRQLYEHFFQVVKERGCQMVWCVTSPVNTVSIKFHTQLGFSIKPGDYEINGIAIHQNYDGIGQDRVVFEKRL